MDGTFVGRPIDPKQHSAGIDLWSQLEKSPFFDRYYRLVTVLSPPFHLRKVTNAEQRRAVVGSPCVDTTGSGVRCV